MLMLSKVHSEALRDLFKKVTSVKTQRRQATATRQTPVAETEDPELLHSVAQAGMNSPLDVVRRVWDAEVRHGITENLWMVIFRALGYDGAEFKGLAEDLDNIIDDMISFSATNEEAIQGHRYEWDNTVSGELARLGMKPNEIEAIHYLWNRVESSAYA